MSEIQFFCFGPPRAHPRIDPRCLFRIAAATRTDRPTGLRPGAAVGFPELRCHRPEGLPPTSQLNYHIRIKKRELSAVYAKWRRSSGARPQRCVSIRMSHAGVKIGGLTKNRRPYSCRQRRLSSARMERAAGAHVSTQMADPTAPAIVHVSFRASAL